MQIILPVKFKISHMHHVKLFSLHCSQFFKPRHLPASFSKLNIPSHQRQVISAARQRKMEDVSKIVPGIHSDFAQLTDTKKNRLCGREVCIKITTFVAYFGLLLWRFIALILFSVHVTDCLLREKHSSYGCENFTLFSHANELEVAWQTASVINSLIAIAVLVKVPGYKGYLSTLRSNSKHARFWSLFFQLLATFTSKIVVISTGLPTMSALIEIGYIAMEVSSTFVVYLWNGVHTPWKDSGVPMFRVARGAYILSLLVFILEYFYLFIITSAQVAFQVTGLYFSPGVSSAVQIVVVVLNATEATFYYSVMKFFWNKWFYGERNLLITDNV